MEACRRSGVRNSIVWLVGAIVPLMSLSIFAQVPTGTILGTVKDPSGAVVADNVLSHADPLAEYSRARQADPTLESVTVPLDRGLELSVVLRES